MKAAVLYETNQPLVIEEVELDPPKKGEVHVKIGAAGVCRSDLHFMHGDAIIQTPAILGHEGAGTVLDVGEGVTSVKPGDDVILSFVPNCGRCPYCLSGRANLCDLHGATSGTLFDGTNRLHIGDQYITPMGKVGCFAQESVVPESGCILLPKGFPLPQAALIGCSVTTGVGAAMYNAEIKPGSTVAVFGVGGVGLNVIQGARLLGASKIIAVDIHQSKLEFASKFGATNTVDASSGDSVAKVKELTDGLGADYTFEVFGSSETVLNAYHSVKKGGQVIIVGIAPVTATAAIDPVSLVRFERTVKGCYYGSAVPNIDMPTMVTLYKTGQIDIDSLITREYSLDEINQAYKDLDTTEIGRGVITKF